MLQYIFFLFFYFLTIHFNSKAELFFNAQEFNHKQIIKKKQFQLPGNTYLSCSSHHQFSDKAFNNQKQAVNLLEMYGDHTMYNVAASTLKNTGIIEAPGNDPLNLYAIFQNLTALGSTNNFGILKFNGHYRNSTYLLEFTTFINHESGIIVRLPFVRRTIKTIQFTDLSPETGNAGLNQINSDWTDFIAEFDALLALYGLSKKSYCEEGFSDASLHVFLTKKNPYTPKLEHTIQCSLLMPIDSKKNQDYAFALPLGYDNHAGFGITCKTTAHCTQSVAISQEFSITHFFKKESYYRMMTDPAQKGFIKLSLGQAKKDIGNLITVQHSGIFSFKKSLIIEVGHSYYRQNKTILTPFDTRNFDAQTVNQSAELEKRYVHNLFASVTMAVSKRKVAEQIECSFAYHKTISGKNVIKNNLLSGGLTIGFSLFF